MIEGIIVLVMIACGVGLCNWMNMVEKKNIAMVMRK